MLVPNTHVPAPSYNIFGSGQVLLLCWYPIHMFLHLHTIFLDLDKPSYYTKHTNSCTFTQYSWSSVDLDKPRLRDSEILWDKKLAVTGVPSSSFSESSWFWGIHHVRLTTHTYFFLLLIYLFLLAGWFGWFVTPVGCQVGWYVMVVNYVVCFGW